MSELQNLVESQKTLIEKNNELIESVKELVVVENKDIKLRLDSLEANSHPNRVFLVTIALILSFFAFIGTFFIYSLSTTKIAPTIQSGGQLNINSNNNK
jgi:hypothetical protein